MVKQIIGPLELRGMKLSEAGDNTRLHFHERFLAMYKEMIVLLALSCRIGVDVGTSGSGADEDQGRSSAQSEGRLVFELKEWERRSLRR